MITQEQYECVVNDVGTMHDPGGTTIQQINDKDFLVMREPFNSASVYMDGELIGIMPIAYVAVCICSPDPIHAFAVYEEILGGI